MSGKKGKGGFGGRQILLLGLVALVITAGYYRWTVEKENLGLAVPTASEVSSPETVDDKEKPKDSGEVGEGNSEKLAKMRQDRDSARSVASEEWTKISKDSEVSQENRRLAEEKVKQGTEAAEKERNIEAQVKAKGYDDCFAYISENGVAVTVCGGETDGAKVAQIKDIIVSETNVPVKNIKINSL